MLQLQPQRARSSARTPAAASDLPQASTGTSSGPLRMLLYMCLVRSEMKGLFSPLLSERGSLRVHRGKKERKKKMRKRADAGADADAITPYRGLPGKRRKKPYLLAMFRPAECGDMYSAQLDWNLLAL
jgi:hypothetical protein